MKRFGQLTAIVLVIVLLVSMTACSSKDKVVVASKPFTESYILAEIIAQLIERDTDLEVELKHGIAGGTSNIHPAMEKGEIDMYPEYTGTSWLFVLKEELINDPIALYEATKKAYAEKYNFVYMGLYGFNNTYTLAMKKDEAETLGIVTFSDLAAHTADLTLGSEPDFFERDDGYNALADVYGYDFKENVEMAIGLKYQAIGDGEVDVINAFSTDGLLKEFNLKVLQDDKNFFPAYHASTVIKQETLDKHPELEKVLDKLKDAISDEVMTEMNFMVDKEGKEAKDVAKDFLDNLDM